MIYTTVAQIEGAIALQQDLRWHAKDPLVRAAASARVAELRAMRLKLKEQPRRSECSHEYGVVIEVDGTPYPRCKGCGKAVR